MNTRRIAVLTSSRADYGIYLPLLRQLKSDPFFSLQLIVFGTHLSPQHGYTLEAIQRDGFTADYQIESILAADTPNAIATSMALTSLKFAEFWNTNRSNFDLVFCLGDRYEMFAAVSAGIPYRIPFAHLHGGETTLGAIDNVFRDALTHASCLHFVSCDQHAQRVAQLTASNENIYTIGSLSLDNLKAMPLLSTAEFYDLFQVDLTHPTVLVTVHPETVSYDKNECYASEIVKALSQLVDYQVLITLPNADTSSLVIRTSLLNLQKEQPHRVRCVENLGVKGYFSAMKQCSFLLGNTSSGIIEAASFGKWVVNVGDRQKGRFQSQNVRNVPFDSQLVLDAIRSLPLPNDFTGTNIYFKENAALQLCNVLKQLDDRI